jgi:hypothetical protein
MSKQTALQALIEWAISLKDREQQCTDWIVIKHKAEELLLMEKEQIEDAYDDGVSEGEMRGESDYENEDRFDSCTSSTTYYNETYGSDK